MSQNTKNIRIVSFVLLFIGLFLPMVSIKFLGMSRSISLLDLVTNIQLLSVFGDVSDLITAVYIIFLSICSQ